MRSGNTTRRQPRGTFCQDESKAPARGADAINEHKIDHATITKKAQNTNINGEVPNITKVVAARTTQFQTRSYLQ